MIRLKDRLEQKRAFLLYGFWVSDGVERGKSVFSKYYLERALWSRVLLPLQGLLAQKGAEPQQWWLALLHKSSLDFIKPAPVLASMSQLTVGHYLLKRCWYFRAWEGRCHHFCFANEKTDFLGLSGLFKVMMMVPESKSRSSDKCHWPKSPRLLWAFIFSSALLSYSSCKLKPG